MSTEIVKSKTQKERFMALMKEMDIEVDEASWADPGVTYYQLGSGAATIGFDEDGKKVYFHGAYE